MEDCISLSEAYRRPGGEGSGALDSPEMEAGLHGNSDVTKQLQKMMKTFKMIHGSQPWWDTPVIPEPGRLRQEDSEFEVN